MKPLHPQSSFFRKKSQHLGVILCHPWVLQDRPWFLAMQAAVWQAKCHWKISGRRHLTVHFDSWILPTKCTTETQKWCLDDDIYIACGHTHTDIYIYIFIYSYIYIYMDSMMIFWDNGTTGATITTGIQQRNTWDWYSRQRNHSEFSTSNIDLRSQNWLKIIQGKTYRGNRISSIGKWY